MQFTNNDMVRAWLATLGYQLSGQPHERVAAMFRKEARQWGLTPDQLRTLIGDPDATHVLISDQQTTPQWQSLSEA